jgi:hypothetical protein
MKGLRDMIVKDHRNDKQRETHKHFVVGYDTFLSGWGKAAKGPSYVVWACDSYTLAKKVCEWIRTRSDMNYKYIV